MDILLIAKNMIVSLIIILLISLSGLSLTYLFAKDETFLWRLSAGNIVGSALFGLVCFVIANFFGLSVVTVLIALVISALPLLLLRDKVAKRRLKDDWQRGKDKNQGINYRKVWRIVYYLFFLILFIAFFDRAMIVGNDGIFTGGSQNFGDLPYHLGAIFSFTDGNNFPPQNPSFAGAKFTYPFIADFLTACLVKFGASVQSVMFVQNVFWAFSLLVILERFVFKVTNNRLAGKIAPFILFFSGGFGFLWFFKDYWYGTQGLWEILWNLPTDYTISDKFRWGNSLVVLFITQRSLLLGMPLTIIVLGKLWAIFATENTEEDEEEKDKLKVKGRKIKENSSESLAYLSPFIVGLLAGTLPLIHAHSLAVLFVVSAFLFFFSLQNWKEWIAFAAGVCVIAVPELIWFMTGSATKTSEFIAWHFGWDSQGENLLLFWIKNTGIFIILLIVSFGLVFFPQSRKDAKEEQEEISKNDLKKQKLKSKRQKSAGKTRHSSLVTRHLIFFLPFLFLFIISNMAKFAPWEWDNIKVLIYWFVGAIPFVSFLLAWLWQRNNFVLKALAISCFVTLIFAGALDVWRTASAQVKNQVFDADAVKIADKLKRITEPDDLFLNAPTFNSAIVLTGRRSLMRYSGHLSSHGIDYAERENDVKKIYAGDGTAEVLMRKYGIKYVLISPRERDTLQVNEQFFQKYRVVAEEGNYRIYEVK